MTSVGHFLKTSLYGFPPHAPAGPVTDPCQVSFLIIYYLTAGLGNIPLHFWSAAFVPSWLRSVCYDSTSPASHYGAPRMAGVTQDTRNR